MPCIKIMVMVIGHQHYYYWECIRNVHGVILHYTCTCNYLGIRLTWYNGTHVTQCVTTIISLLHPTCLCV